MRTLRLCSSNRIFRFSASRYPAVSRTHEAFASVRFPEKLDDGERKGRSETDQQKTFSQREEAEARQDKHAIDRFGDPDCENLPPPVVLSQA